MRAPWTPLNRPTTPPSREGGIDTTTGRDTFSQVAAVLNDASPASQAAEMVPYRSPAIEETWTQEDRRVRADAGELQARLDLIPLQAAEDQLSRRFRTTRQDRSILTCLIGGDGTQPPHEAAKAVLEELADITEQAAFTSTLVYKIVQARGLWRADPSLTSAEAFLDSLDNAEHVKTNIQLGSSAQLVKWRSIRRIEKRWGVDWFDAVLREIPDDIRDVDWTRPEECSKRILMQMAQNAERGHSLLASTAHWKAAMAIRTDEDIRDKHGITVSRARWIILDDIRSLNKMDDGHLDTSIQSQLQDRMRVQLVPVAAEKDELPRPNRKRKRIGVSHPDESGDGWRMAADGNALIKNVRGHAIRKPVEPAGETESAPTPISIRGSPTPPASPVVSESEPDHSSPEPVSSCAGPAVARRFEKLLDLYDEIRSEPEPTPACCEACSTHVLHLLTSFQAEVVPAIERLQAVTTHVSVES